jgi:hypothetical protein
VIVVTGETSLCCLKLRLSLSWGRIVKIDDEIEDEGDEKRSPLVWLEQGLGYKRYAKQEL